MIYVLDDGRVLSDFSLINDEKYIELLEYPSPVYKDGKIGVIVGIEDGAIKYKFVDEQFPDIPDVPIPEPTEQEKLISELMTTIMEINAKLGSV